MKAKFGAIVVDGRGKIGGHVASKNRAGSYFRTKVTPVNPQSTRQNTVRSLFTSLSQSFRSLTDAQIAAWNAAVSNFQTTNIFGDLKTPSGFNLYQRLNNNLSRIGEAVIDTPPLPAAVEDIVIGTLTAAAGAGTMSLAYTAGAAGSVIEVYATPGVSPGISYVKNLYRRIGQFDSETVSPFNAAAAYALVFGSVPVAGQKVFVKTVAVNSTTGQMGTPQSTSAVVAA